jgi:hypothetical protein
LRALEELVKRTLAAALVLLGAASNPARCQDYYLLVAMHSQKCVQVLSESRDNAGIIGQWDCGPQDTFKWKKIDVGDGYFQLQSVYSNKCIQVSAALRSSGVLITQWDCLAQPHLQWKEVFVERSLGRSFYQIVSKLSEKCLHVAGASNDNGAFLIQADCVDQPNVKWAISGRTRTN